MTTEDVDSLIAGPGDPDLDLHVWCLRVTAVTVTDGPDLTEVAVGYDTTVAAGWWAAGDGGRFVPDKITGLGSCFGLPAMPLVDVMIARLERWRDHGTLIEMTAAPGKWTLLRGPAPDTGTTVEVIHPRAEPPPAEFTDPEVTDDPQPAGVPHTGRYVTPLGRVTADPAGGGPAADGIALLIRPAGWRGLFYGTCPACGDRFRRGRWCWNTYSGHYCTAHLGITLYARPGGAP